MSARSVGDFNSIPSASGGIARLACARMREQGMDLTSVLSSAGLTPDEINSPNVRIEVRRQIKVLELAAQQLQDDFLGFHLALTFDLRELGLLYYAMASSEDLANALRTAERYSRLMNEGVQLHFRVDTETTISLDYIDVDRQSDRHQIEFWLITVVRICRQITNSRLAPRRVKVRHPRDNVPPSYKRFLGSDLEAGARADQIVFKRTVASLPIVGADIYLNKLLLQYADEALSHRSAPGPGIRADVEREIALLLPHGKASALEVSRKLRLSIRTFSRSLAAENLTFRLILREFREALAKRYLCDNGLSISEIAWLLGFEEVGAFSHAFKRWTGATPRHYRSSIRP